MPHAPALGHPPHARTRHFLLVVARLRPTAAAVRRESDDPLVAALQGHVAAPLAFFLVGSVWAFVQMYCMATVGTSGASRRPSATTPLATHPRVTVYRSGPGPCACFRPSLYPSTHSHILPSQLHSALPQIHAYALLQLACRLGKAKTLYGHVSRCGWGWRCQTCMHVST